MCSSKDNQAKTLAQANNRGCCSSAAKDTIIKNPIFQSGEVESPGCCESAGGKACSDKTDINVEIKIEDTACCVAPATKPASDAEAPSRKVGRCSGVIEDAQDRRRKAEPCCSSVESPELASDVEIDAKLDGCCASKSKPKASAVFVPRDKIIPLPSEDKVDDCCSSKDQGISTYQEIVPPCCQGIASNCCDGNYFHAKCERES